MKVARNVCLVVVLLAPLVASAQGDDAAYCGKLVGLARTYISGRCSECRPDLNIEGAAVDCSKGKYESAIPYLENRLRAYHVTLPPRS